MRDLGFALSDFYYQQIYSRNRAMQILVWTIMGRKTNLATHSRSPQMGFPSKLDCCKSFLSGALDYIYFGRRLGDFE